MTDMESLEQAVEEEAYEELQQDLEAAFSHIEDVISKYNNGSLELGIDPDGKITTYAHSECLTLKDRIYTKLKDSAKKKKIKAFLEGVKCFQRKEGL